MCSCSCLYLWVWKIASVSGVNPSSTIMWLRYILAQHWLCAIYSLSTSFVLLIAKYRLCSTYGWVPTMCYLQPSTSFVLLIADAMRNARDWRRRLGDEHHLSALYPHVETDTVVLEGEIYLDMRTTYMCAHPHTCVRTHTRTQTYTYWCIWLKSEVEMYRSGYFLLRLDQSSGSSCWSEPKRPE